MRAPPETAVCGTQGSSYNEFTFNQFGKYMTNLQVTGIIVGGLFVTMMILGSDDQPAAAQSNHKILSQAESSDYGRTCAKYERHSRYPLKSASAMDKNDGEIYVVIQHTDGTTAHCIFSGGIPVRGGSGMY